MVKQYHILILALLLTSCARAPSQVGIASSDIEAIRPGQAIILGRVKFVREGEPVDWDSSAKGWTFQVHILSDTDPHPIPYALTGDGSFYWHLHPGGYTITEFRWYWPSLATAQSRNRRIFAHFIVPETTSLVYIGTLTIRFEEGRYTMRIDDEYDRALEKVTSLGISGEVTKHLMQLGKGR
jgi:hypothetical protein